MKTALIATLTALLAALPASGQEEWESSMANVSDDVRHSAETVKGKLEEISLLNLVNGLYLSKEQSARIIELAAQAGELRDRTIERHAATIRKFEEALCELQKYLLDCKPVPPEIEQAASGKKHELDDIRKRGHQELIALEKNIRRVLTPAQVSVVENFSPCLIPPKDLKDPVRAGQAGSERTELENHLRTLRAIPDRAYPAVSEAFAELLLSFQEKHLGTMDAARREKETVRLAKLFAKIRAMDEADFEMEKCALAEQAVLPTVEYRNRATELQTLFIKHQGGLTKVGKYLLNPRVIPLLKVKMEHDCETSPADLEKIRAAESCRVGCGKESTEPAVSAPARRPGLEPTWTELAGWMRLDGQQSETARRLFQDAQRDLLTLLGEPRRDGRNMVREAFTCLFEKRRDDLILLLSEPFPGADDTYLERIKDIKLGLNDELAGLLDAKQYDRWLDSNIDPFKVKAYQ